MRRAKYGPQLNLPIALPPYPSKREYLQALAFDTIRPRRWAVFLLAPDFQSGETDMSEQSSSRVRDHLANERTFLAWVRTSVSLMGFGVVIARLRYLTLVAPVPPDPGASPARSTLLGLAFVGVGLLSLLFAALNFYRTRRAIESSDFQPLGTLLLVFVVVLFALGIAAAVYLLALAGRT